MQTTLDVRHFGAVGDGAALDTAAIQRCIDTCHRQGGGQVLLPPGLYRSGSIKLKDRVDLHLEAGATLLGSAKRDDYKPLPGGASRWAPLISAVHANGIAVSGRGCIDGNGRAFFQEVPGQQRKQVRNWRPGHLLSFIACNDVLVRDIELRDSPIYSIWPLGCDTVRIQGVTIRSDRWGPNTDGIDPDCSKNVFISDCLVDAGDDCIALKSDARSLGYSKACENVVVSNCVLRTSCCAVRIGYEGDAPIRNCTFSNLVISDTRTGINMLVPHDVGNNPNRHIEHGPAIENLRFSNLVMDTQVALYLWIGHDAAAPGCIRNIAITDVTASTGDACFVHGSPTIPIEDLRLRNWRLSIRGKPANSFAEEVPFPFPAFGFHGRRTLPYGFFLRHARNLKLQNIAVDWDQAEGQWLNTLRAEQVENLQLQDLDTDAAPESRAPCLALVDTHGVRGHACRCRTPDAPLLDLRGKTSDIRIDQA